MFPRKFQSLLPQPRHLLQDVDCLFHANFPVAVNISAGSRIVGADTVRIQASDDLHANYGITDINHILSVEIANQYYVGYSDGEYLLHIQATLVGRENLHAVAALGLVVQGTRR